MALILQYLMTDTETNKPVGWYYCFSKDTPIDKAKQLYIKRFKEEPQEIFIYKNLLWVGPVTDSEYNPTVGNNGLNLQSRIDSLKGRKEDE